MKTTLLTLAGLLTLIAGPVVALPATLLPSREWSIPTETDGLVLIDQPTGQVRLAVGNGSGKLVWDKRPLRTYLGEATDVSGGLQGAGGEMIALTNPWTNRIATLELGDGTISSLPTPLLGPAALTEIDTSSPELMTASILGGGGKGTVIQVLDDLPSGGNRLAEKNGYGPISRMEPLFETTAGHRMAVGCMGDTDTVLFLARRSGSGISLTPQSTLSGQWQIAPSIRGVDGRTLVICWMPGSTALKIFTLGGGIGVGSTLTLSGEPDLGLPGGVGSLQRVQLPGAPNGFLATSADGTRGVWAQVDLGSKLLFPKTFEASGSALRLNGLVPVQGHGIVQLDGPPDRPSSVFVNHVWNGSSWESSTPASMPRLLPTGTDFATVFYFDAEPFLTDTAALLGLEILPDWTTGSTTAPFPASITGESYGSSSTGLSSPTHRAFSPPGGAGYLLSNQHQPELSIAALRANDQILDPSLIVQPPSGPSPGTVEVSAVFDSARYDLFYRDSSSSSTWMPWPGAASVAYSSTWYFHLKDKSSGLPGPITSRQWTIPDANLDSIDSDSDGVPDFVEAHAGLDPFGGADSDGDGASDLEELIEGTDPADDGSLPSPRRPLPQGEGIRWLAAAFNHLSTARISLGEMINAHDIAGALLASDDVDPVVHPTLGSQRAAEPTSRTSPAQTEWASLSTSPFFNIGVSESPNGREVIRLVAIPSPSGPTIPFSASGDFASDASAWVIAARAAYSTWHPVDSLTEIRPVHSMAAVLCEAMLHDQLTARELLGEPGIPLDQFTLFPWRSQDASRAPLDREMTTALSASGFDFSALRDLVEDAVTADANLTHAVNLIYAHHIANFSTDPALETPLAVLREWVSTGSLPASYTSVVSGTALGSATTSISQIRSRSAEAFRPTETWPVVVLPQNSQAPGVVRMSGDGSLVALLRPTGEPFLFEQGLGILEGTTMSVAGFTDVTSPTGFPAMEVTAIVYQSLPAASARDQDANLLDDEWERFFFGTTGNDAFSVPSDSNFSLLEHYFLGSDPRGGSDPAGLPVDLSPPPLSIANPSPGGFTIDFLYPEAYAGNMEFIVEGSPNLSPGSFMLVPGATLSHLGGDEYRITLPPVPDDQDYQFYRVRLALGE